MCTSGTGRVAVYPFCLDWPCMMVPLPAAGSLTPLGLCGLQVHSNLLQVPSGGDVCRICLRFHLEVLLCQPHIEPHSKHNPSSGPRLVDRSYCVVLVWLALSPASISSSPKQSEPSGPVCTYAPPFLQEQQKSQSRLLGLILYLTLPAGTLRPHCKERGSVPGQWGQV